MSAAREFVEAHEAVVKAHAEYKSVVEISKEATDAFRATELERAGQVANAESFTQGFRAGEAVGAEPFTLHLDTLSKELSRETEKREWSDHAAELAALRERLRSTNEAHGGLIEAYDRGVASLRAKVAKLEAERHDATGGVGRAITVEHLIDSHLYTASAVREVFVNTVRASGALAVDLNEKDARLADLERENERLQAQIVAYEQDVTRLNMELSKAQRMPQRRALTEEEVLKARQSFYDHPGNANDSYRVLINTALDILGATPAPDSLSDAECVALLRGDQRMSALTTSSAISRAVRHDAHSPKTARNS